jgi:hypothetical protein
MSIIYFGNNMRRTSWILSTVVLGFLGLSYTLPASAQFQQYPVQSNPITPFDRPQQPLVQPSPGFPPFSNPLVSADTCNSSQNPITTFVGIPSDQSRPPRIGQFVIPANTCLRVDSNGNTLAVANQQLGNRSVFSLCQYVNVRGQQGFINSRYLIECGRTDGQVDRIRTRGSNFFDQLRRGDEGRDGGIRQIR